MQSSRFNAPALRAGRFFLAGLMLAALVGSGARAAWAGARLWSQLPPNAPTARIELPDFTTLAARLSPAVVNIAVEERTVAPGSDELLPAPEAEPYDQPNSPGAAPEESHPHGVGSGFLINKAGFILTNDHVVANARAISVTTSDGERYSAHLIGRDPKSDVALIKIDSKRPLPVAPLGDSGTVKVGEWVMAIGNPFGFDHTVTVGIVSAKGRFIPGNYDEFLQTDASINPGNSGGPLIDTRGEVVGVNSAIYTRTGSNTGISFAIPIDLVKRELPELQTTHKVVRGWLGIYIESLTPEMAAKHGLDGPHGALVDEVVDPSPAKTAGLQKGDIVLAFNGHLIGDSQELPLMVGAVPLGERAMLQIIRGNVRRTIPVTIAASREAELASAAEPGRAEPPLGLAVENLDAGMARELGLEKSGVLVDTVTPGSAAAQAGLQPRDIIIEVNRQAVGDVDAYQRALKEGSKGRAVLLLVKRGKSAVFVPVVPEQ
ncbi:MAG TPA: Do family serine endopeptidase [Candidatus Binataceae bacterium]|nr:Do family serine endopeptidase [Candidatus Binataceae bacterium]